jgi:hypothetical protein
MAEAGIDAGRFLEDPQPSPALRGILKRLLDGADALYARIQAEFGSRTQLDLVATVAAYNMVSRLLVALHIGH